MESHLVQHLQVLVHTASIELWTADRVRAGEDRQQVSEAALMCADVALLLLSADFLASEFLQNVELPKLLQRSQLDGLTVIPVLIRSCLWQAHPWLSTLKLLPASGEPIASFLGDDRDRVLTEIAAEIAQRAGTPCSSTAGGRISATLGDGRRPVVDIARAVEVGRETNLRKEVLFRTWNREEAVGHALEQLRDFGKALEYGLGDLSSESENVSHEVHDFLHLKHTDHSVYVAVVVTRTDPRNDCHSSAPALSFVEFIETPRGWVLGAVYANALHAGAWGDPPSDISAMEIGRDVFAVVIKGGWTGQGYTMGYTSIHAILGGELKEVFTADTYGNDSATGLPHRDDWSADIKTVKRGLGFYDLAVHRHGLRDGNSLNEKMLYRFDGGVYAPLGSYR